MAESALTTAQFEAMVEHAAAGLEHSARLAGLPTAGVIIAIGVDGSFPSQVVICPTGTTDPDRFVAQFAAQWLRTNDTPKQIEKGTRP